MQLIIMGCIATIIVSFFETIRVINSFYKEVFNKGYKLNDKKKDEMNDFF